MTCERMRVALSARLDHEDPGMSPAALDAHLAACAGCRDWLHKAERVSRAVRVQAVELPDLTATVLAAVAADAAVRPTVDPELRPPAGNRLGAAHGADAEARSRRQILRVAVGVAAVAQLSLALPALMSGLGVAADPHAGREMASFDIALAVGFVLAAHRPERARAFVPVAFVLAACLAITSAVDMANASTAMIHEVGHLAAVAQAALLWALGRATPRTVPPGMGAPVAVRPA